MALQERKNGRKVVNAKLLENEGRESSDTLPGHFLRSRSFVLRITINGKRKQHRER